MAIDARDLEKALLAKGFRLERNTTDKLFYLYYQGRRTQVHTKISHGRSEELRNKLSGMVKRQMCLDSSHQLTRFVDCDLTAEGYIQHLRDKQLL